MVNNFEVNIHNVKEMIEIPKYRLTEGTYVKVLHIKTNDGTYEITLFGKTQSNLVIRTEGKYEQTK